jgi:hypothetical protein
MTLDTWKLNYLQGGDANLPRTRLLSSMHDALSAGCALRKRHKVLDVQGPNGEIFDAGAIEKWCVEYGR